MFDTLKFANRLKEAGVRPIQAEAEASALAEAFGEVDVTTKRDRKDLEIRLISEIKTMKWMLGIIVGGIIALVLKTFFPLYPARGASPL